MVTFEELVEKYKLFHVAPYGACIIVPGDEFDPDWEAVLADEGCRFHFVDLGGKAVTLVQKGKKSEAGEEKLVYEPPSAEESSGKVVTKEDSKNPKQETMRETAKVARHKKYGDDWRPEEEAFLISLHQEGLPYYKISERMKSKFPSRTEHAVFYRIYALMQQGRLQRRFEHRKLKSKKGSRGPGEERPVSPASSANLQPSRWTEAENQLLIDLWNQKLKAPQMVGKFPGRSEQAIKMRLARLREKGLIKPRWKQGKKRKTEKEPKGSAGPEAASTPVHTPTVMEPAGPVKDPILSALEEIRDLLVKHSKPETVLFKAYCRTWQGYPKRRGR